MNEERVKTYITRILMICDDYDQSYIDGTEWRDKIAATIRAIAQDAIQQDKESKK